MNRASLALLRPSRVSPPRREQARSPKVVFSHIIAQLYMELRDAS